MKNLYSLLFILPLLAFTNTCTDTEECLALLAPLHNLEEQYGCVDTKKMMDIDLTDEFQLIYDQAEFDSLVTGTCQPEINFDAYTLLIGKKALISGNDRIEYDQEYDCNTGHHDITVTFYQNFTDEAPNLTYHVLMHGKINRDKLSLRTVVIEP